MANTASGEILAWDVAGDGALSNQRVFADGLVIPDGLCVAGADARDLSVTAQQGLYRVTLPLAGIP